MVDCPIRNPNKQRLAPLLKTIANAKDNTKIMTLNFDGNCCQSCGANELQPAPACGDAICLICQRTQPLDSQMVACVQCGKFDACLSCYIRVKPASGKEQVTIT